MEDRKIKDIFGCSYIEIEEYPLQKWYNQLLDKTISEINVSDVLRMIRQKEFLEIAVPRAIFFLNNNPFEGEMYEGELLEKVSNLEILQVKHYIDDIKNILAQAQKDNETYAWLIEEERMKFQELTKDFSKKITTWDDSRDEIMDIVEVLEDNTELQFPLKCPICNTNKAHIYMHRWDEERGTIWTWCSNCKSCTHGSRMKLPGWWKNADFIDDSELTSHPIFLEDKASLIDKHVKELRQKRLI